MITRIEAYRYKCFERLQLDVGRYQVIVGRNGAGKSTLLDIPVLLGEMLEARSVERAFFGERDRLPPRAVTAQDLIFGNKGDWFAFALEARLPDVLAFSLERKRFEEGTKKEQDTLQKNPGRSFDSLRYEIAFRVDGGTIEISQEHFFLLPRDRSLIGDTPAGLWGDSVNSSAGGLHRVIGRASDGGCLIEAEVGKRSAPLRANMTPLTPALSGAPVDLGQFAATDWFRNHLGRDVLAVDLNLGAMREPQLQRSAGFSVSADGTTLPLSVKELQKHPARHEEWVTHVSSALPLLQNVTAREQEADKRLYLEVDYRSGHSVRSIGLSDGTLSLLALSILPFLERVPSLVTIEEPENGIHPKAIEVILESLQVIDDAQVWVTTHSPIVVAVTKPEHLICLSMTKSEGVKAVRGDQHELLSHWEGIPTLDVLFSAGVL